LHKSVWWQPIRTNPY